METARATKKSLLEAFNMLKLSQLNELRKENEFCDLILKTEDGFEIKVHRNVVSSASNYFKDLLTLPMKEKFEESILQPDITADVLEKIITFIYTSEFEEEIEDVEKIVKYAVIFQLEQLAEICSLALSESITDHSCLKYWRLARNNLIYSLEDKCLEYITSQADHLFESSLMCDLTIEEMRCLLADTRLHQRCDEKKIFEHAWKWAEGKVSETNSFSQIFSEIVDLLHFSKLEIEFVFKKLFGGGHDDVLANAELLRKVAKLTKQKYEDKVPSGFLFYKPTQRLLGCATKKMFIGLGEENTIEKEIKFRGGFGYTTFDNKLLICGGQREISITNSCELFEPSTQQWKVFPSMKTKTWCHQCSYVDNRIYACGGVDIKTVEIFDFGKGEWTYGPEMPANNCNFGLTGINGGLYAIGGGTDYVKILDPRTQKWNIVCSDSRIKRHVRCVSIGPCIYCFTYQKRLIFDTRSNKFTEEICCDNFNYGFDFCELDGYFYGFGYHEDSGNKYSLDLVQNHIDGKVGFKKSYGLYNPSERYKIAIVSLYY